MFLRTVKAKVNGDQTREYVRLVESYREAGHVKQRVVANLGRADLLAPHLNDLERLLGRGNNEPERHLPRSKVSDPVLMTAAHRDGKKAILSGSELFSGLTEEQLNRLSSVTFERHLKAAEYLYLEGDTLAYFYVIAEGRLKLVRHSASGRDFILGFGKPGEMLGNVSLFSDEPHPTSAQAVIDTKVLGMKDDDFRSFISDDCAAGYRILSKMLTIVTARYLSSSRRLVDLAAEKSEHRLANILLSLSLEHGLILAFTREEIAQMAGTTTETAIRFIRRLNDAGIVRRLRRKIVILNKRELESLLDNAGCVSAASSIVR